MEGYTRGVETAKDMVAVAARQCASTDVAAGWAMEKIQKKFLQTLDSRAEGGGIENVGLRLRLGPLAGSTAGRRPL